MRISTRSRAQSVLVGVLTAFAAAMIAMTQIFTTAITAAVGLTAVRALIVPGTGTSDPSVVPNYMENAVGHYLVPGGVCDATCSQNGSPVPVPYIAQFWPIPGWGGLQGAKWNVSVQSGIDSLVSTYSNQTTQHPSDDITIFGYSQGATVATIVKGNLRGLDQASKNKLNFFFIGDPQRPNGGFFERLAFLGTVPILDATFGRPAPTDTCMHVDGNGNESTCATDFAFQYDGVVDSPQWLLNPLAVINALAGLEYIHGTYLSPDDDEVSTAHPYGYSVQEVKDAITAAQGNCTADNYCQTHGDTIYITLPARTLPMYQPVLDLGNTLGVSAIVVPIVDLVQPATQTLIETAYNRTDYGAPTPSTLLPPLQNPITVATSLVNDIPLGIKNALTPGLQPLPGSAPEGSVVNEDGTVTPPVASLTTRTATTDTTNVVAAQSGTPDRPLVRLSTIARPKVGILALSNGSSANSTPLRSALGDVHPVRDVVKAVTGAVDGAVNSVNKALGKDDGDSAAKPAA